MEEMMCPDCGSELTREEYKYAFPAYRKKSERGQSFSGLLCKKCNVIHEEKPEEKDK